MLTATPISVSRTFTAVSNLYDRLVPGAFVKKADGTGYFFSFECKQNKHFSFRRYFRNLNCAIAQFSTVEEQFYKVKAAAESYVQQQPTPTPKTCKVCIHRELDGDGFHCGARAIGRLLLTQDPGADGCRQFKEYRHDA